MNIFISLHIQQIMAHSIICPFMYHRSNLHIQNSILIVSNMLQSVELKLQVHDQQMEIRNLINSSINDDQLASLNLGKIRYSFFIFHETVPDTSSKLCRNKITESSHCGCIERLGSTKANRREFLEKYLQD